MANVFEANPIVTLRISRKGDRYYARAFDAASDKLLMYLWDRVADTDSESFADMANRAVSDEYPDALIVSE